MGNSHGGTLFVSLFEGGGSALRAEPEGVSFVQELLSLVGLRLIADGADLRLRHAVFGVVAEEVYVPLNITALLLHREQHFKGSVGVVHGAVGVHAVHAVGLYGVAQLVRIVPPVLINRHDIEKLRLFQYLGTAEPVEEIKEEAQIKLRVVRAHERLFPGKRADERRRGHILFHAV